MLKTTLAVFLILAFSLGGCDVDPEQTPENTTSEPQPYVTSPPLPPTVPLCTKPEDFSKRAGGELYNPTSIPGCTDTESLNELKFLAQSNAAKFESWHQLSVSENLAIGYYLCSKINSQGHQAAVDETFRILGLGFSPQEMDIVVNITYGVSFLKSNQKCR